MKTIYCFGTSMTSGGGYEFTSKSKWNKIPSVYHDIADVNMNQKFFSWPGQLQSLSDSFKVVNMAKTKVGQEYIWRTSFELIESLSDEQIEKSIFLFQYAGIGNKEVYLNILGDTINVNYNYESADYKNIPKLIDSKLHKEIIESLKNSIMLTGLSKNYLFDDKKIGQIFETHKNEIESYIRNTSNMDREIEYIARNNKMFESYLSQKGVNYVILDKIKWNTPYEESPFLSENYNETITCETDEFVKDNHNNLTTNRYIAGYIFNSLINYGLLNEKEINVEYPYL